VDERSIFMTALERESPPERSAYLDGACGGDTALRQRVEALLASHQQAGSFLRVPIPERLAENVATPASVEETGGDAPATEQRPRPLPEGQGSRIGPYKLLQELGEGGMGTVWMAEQTQPVQRKVALKIIKPGMDSRQVIARFEAERQALALMDHPNIATVLDGGTTDSGRPYFVMELVKGVPITKFCDEQRLTPRQRLELFVPVCQAVQHAHQKGIIHRDLKPSNVLVCLYDGRPVPKVIDFGVAKAAGQKLTERTMFTEIGQVVGTLDYMSPEQAELNQLDIDTRSDIYSLGVLLYELLTGSTPLDKKRLKEAAFMEVLRVIREQEPTKPSTKLSTAEGLPTLAANRGTEPAKLTRLVRGELDWIVMKALEKDRNRRYETANGFAMDVQRYLADEPVQACPPSMGYRLRKFARRNKGVLTGVVAIAASIVLGLSVTIVLLVTHAREMKEEHDHTTKEYNRAELALVQAKGNLERADQNLAVALEALDDVYMQDVEDRIIRGRRMTKAERASLEKGLQFYERFAQQNSGHAQVERVTARAYRRAGFLRLDLKDWTQAQDYFAKAIAVFEKWADPSRGSVEDQVELARSCYGMTLSLRRAEKHHDAAPICQRAIALWEKLSADLHLPNHRVELGHCLWELGQIMSSDQQHDKAEKTLREAVRLFEALAAKYPNEPFYRQEVGYSHRGLGDILRTAGLNRQASESYKKAALAYKSLATQAPGNAFYRYEMGLSTYLFACSLRDTRPQQEAEDAYSQEAAEAYRQSLTIYENLVAEFPDNLQRRQGLATIYEALIQLLTRAGQRQHAQEVHRRAVKFYEKLAAARPDESVAAHALVEHLHSLGRTEEAEKVCRQAIESLEKLAAANPKVSEHREELARHYRYLQQWDKAIDACTEAIKLQPNRWQLWSSRGFAYLASQQWDNCIRDYTKAIELAPNAHTNWLHRGIAYTNLGQWDNVVSDFTNLLKRYPADYNAWHTRAVAYTKLNQPELAVSDLRQALAKGYKDLEGIRTDDRFTPLRNREDFKKLLAEMDGKKKK
jgi:serine/threonine protein kinase/tetratricopeptide (TPR) repeat protein